MSPINSDEHSEKRYVRSGREQPLAPEHRDKPGASSSLNRATPEKLGRVCKRSGTEGSASEPECSGDEQSQPIFMSAGDDSSRSHGDGRSVKTLPVVS